MERHTRRIGPHVYDVVPVDMDYMEDAGSCCVDALLIRIRSDLAESAKLETELHECLHAMFSQLAVQLSDKQEEAIVSGLSPLLLRFLQDNPDFGKATDASN